MKLFLYFTILLNILIFSNSAVSEENSKTYDWTTSIGLPGLYLRKSVSENNSIFVGARYYFYKNDYTDDQYDSTNQTIGLEIGHRYYISKSDIQTYIDSSFSFDVNTTDRDGIDNRQYYGLNFLYGLEKFISEQFSVEGAAGIALQYTEDKDDSSLSVYVPRIRVAVNYYF